MNTRSSTLKTYQQLWLNSLMVVLLLASQFMVLEHSTEHFFHTQTDYCLTFQTADASPSLVIPAIVFQLPDRQFENILRINIDSIIVPFRKNFSPRAPPAFI